jgi:hypothetical protein
MDNMTREPCDFVKLVLQRMDSNPDEFEHYGRWNSLCESLERYAGAYNGVNTVSGCNVLWAYDQFEVDLMLAKYREIYRDREYKSMLKNLLVGAEPKAGGVLKSSPFVTQPSPSLSTLITAGSGGHIGATLGSGLQYADNTATVSLGLNPQMRAQIDDAVEAKMQEFKRG